MNDTEINQPNADRASAYLEKKFQGFKKGLYTKASRRKKCLEYWIAANTGRRDLVETIYQRVFGELMDTDTAEGIEAAREKAAAKNVKVAPSDWLQDKRKLRAEATTTLATLKRWRTENDWQEDGFIERLERITAFMSDDDLCEISTFKTEYNAFFEKEVTASLERQGNEISHEASFMAAVKQSAKVEFSTFDLEWGRVAGFFEENFKAGIWANESAKLSWKKTGFNAEVQAAIAIGAQLNLAGELSWENRDRKLTLGGEGEIFLGARANLSAKLGVSAMKGLEAAIDAGFFAGFSATVHGSASFTYMGKEVASVSGDASFTFGVGGSITGSLAVPLFGPTSITFGAGLTIGIGATATVQMKIDFNETRILLTTEFKKLVYIPTLLQGYKMDIQNMEYRNSFYLTKCTARVEAYVKEVDEEIASYKKKPVEKRPLLMSK